VAQHPGATDTLVKHPPATGNGLRLPQMIGTTVGMQPAGSGTIRTPPGGTLSGPMVAPGHSRYSDTVQPVLFVMVMLGQAAVALVAPNARSAVSVRIAPAIIEIARVEHRVTM